MTHATHATHEYITTTRTLSQQFMDSDDFDYVAFEVSKPYPDERDPLIVKIEVYATLVGDEEQADHYGVISIDKSAFDGLSNTDSAFKCIECVYEALGFGEPTPGFQICANTIDGVIFTMRWSISKQDRELTQSQVQEISDFLGAYGEPNLVTLDYGINHINLHQHLLPVLVDNQSAIN